MTAGIIAAKIARTDREIVAEMRADGALSEATAAPLHGTGLRGRRIDRLSRVGVLRLVDNQRYYLDEVVLKQYQHRKRMQILGTLAVVSGLLIAGLVMSLLKR